MVGRVLDHLGLEHDLVQALGRRRKSRDERARRRGDRARGPRCRLLAARERATSRSRARALERPCGARRPSRARRARRCRARRGVRRRGPVHVPSAAAAVARLVVVGRGSALRARRSCAPSRSRAIAGARRRAHRRRLGHATGSSSRRSRSASARATSRGPITRKSGLPIARRATSSARRKVKRTRDRGYARSAPRSRALVAHAAGRSRRRCDGASPPMHASTRMTMSMLDAIRREGARAASASRSTTASRSSASPTCSRSGSSRTRCASGGTATARTSTATCASRSPTSATRRASSARSRSSKEHMPGAHTMTLEEAWHELEDRAMDDPPTEIHIVNGLHPGLPFSYYEELLRGFKRIEPDVHLKCFTAVEIHFFAQHYGMTYAEVLSGCARRGSTACRAAAPRSSTPRCASASRTTRRPPTSTSRCTASRTGWACARTHDALRAHRDVRAPRRSHAPPARAAGRDAAASRPSSRSRSTPTATA